MLFHNHNRRRSMPLFLGASQESPEASSSAPVATITTSRPLTPPPPRYNELDHQRASRFGGQLNQMHPSLEDDVFNSSTFDQVFLRLKDDFTKLAADEVKLQKLRTDIFSKSRHLEAERTNQAAERLRLVEMGVKIDRNRQVVAGQYEAAVEMEKANEIKAAELQQLASSLRVWEEILLAREKMLPPSPTIEHAHDDPASVATIAADYPLSIDQDTLPGLHSSIHAVAANDNKRYPSTEARTLRHRSGTVQRSSSRMATNTLQGLQASKHTMPAYEHYTFPGLQASMHATPVNEQNIHPGSSSAVAANNIPSSPSSKALTVRRQRSPSSVYSNYSNTHVDLEGTIDDSTMTGDSPSKASEVETIIDPVELSGLRHTSSERRDRERGRSVRRMSKSENLRG